MSAFAMMNALMTPGLTATERNVYAYLIFRANGSRTCWPEVKDIANHIGAAPRTVMAATKRLVELNLILSQRRVRDSNNYRIVEVVGLYDRPLFTKPMEVDDLQKTTVLSEGDDLQETEALAPVTCEKQHSDLQKTTQELVHQEREQVSKPREAVCDKANAPDGWVWSKAVMAYVPPPPAPPAKHVNPFIAKWNAIGSPSSADGKVYVNDFDLEYTVQKALTIARMDPERASQKDYERVSGWLSAGYEPSNIHAAIQQRVDRPDFEYAYSLGYFDNPVRTFRRRRVAA